MVSKGPHLLPLTSKLASQSVVVLLHVATPVHVADVGFSAADDGCGRV